MNRFHPAHLLALGSLLLLTAATAAPNQLSETETRDGWRLLFDGQSLQGWRSFKKSGPPDRGWVVADGCLEHVAKGGGGDILSTGEFTEFDLKFSWKLAPEANSGVKYFVTEERATALGHEYQLLDDALNEDARNGRHHQTASFYDVLPPAEDAKAAPVGEWNHSRIVVRGQHVEHWLNNKLALAYDLGSEPVLAAVAKSKFKTVPGFGTRVRGHILLQDHGGQIWFRDLKIRDLAAR